MNREEAAKGTEVQETKHSMKRRCLWHDYHRKGTYMLTLVVAGRLPLFGELVVHPNTFAHASDTPRVECSELGVVIQNEEIRKIPQFYPMVNVWEVCMMPDHIHLIVRVSEDMPEDKHLGHVIAGRVCQIVGNRFLLDIPDKMAVVVHRCYTDEKNVMLRKEWLACGERGGVLVSAAISLKEKEVLREAMNCGYRIILLRENGFPKMYKPSGESFNACSDGLLLQISPYNYHMEKRTITRAQCLELNELVERIAGYR